MITVGCFEPKKKLYLFCYVVGSCRHILAQKKCYFRNNCHLKFIQTMRYKPSIV
ncbi:hypothetical protein Hanom_Chr07g00648681 [Helianthus anomalus]